MGNPHWELRMPRMSAASHYDAMYHSYGHLQSTNAEFLTNIISPPLKNYQTFFNEIMMVSKYTEIGDLLGKWKPLRERFIENKKKRKTNKC